MEQKRFYLTRKKVAGAIFLCLFVLSFVFACLKNTLGIGKIIAHTFGFMTYPLLLIFAICSLAMFMGFSYARNKKSTVYLVLSLVFAILLVHSIATFAGLERVVDSVSLTSYLANNYETMTIFGAFGGALSGLLALALGEMGTIVVFGILTTLFVGLFIDYNFYGKYEASVKKLKGHKLREKVQKSDEKRTAVGSPVYSFSNKYTGSDVVDNVTATEEEIFETKQTEAPAYTDSDVAFSAESDEFDFGEQPFETKQDNSLYGGLSKEDADKHRRDFMSATFGDFENNSFETDYSFETENEESDDISKILNSSEDEGEEEISAQPNFDFDFSKPAAPAADASKDIFAANAISKSFERQNDGFNLASRQEMVRPAQNKPQTKANLQQSMLGVRYNPPPLSLLATPKPDKGDYREEQTRKSKLLESVLAAFNIPATIERIVRGPKITRYELSVPLGVPIKKIPAYENDIAAALSAKTITIRAPIPGSPYVGIELENDTFTTVYQRELFESDAFQNFKDPLPIAIGKDISGEIVVRSLADMTHLLIAGSTGSGKSVFIHNIVLSLIYKNSPEDVKLIMIDPKRVEFNRYNGLPHLITPEVVMGAHKAINALKWCVAEMDRRYDLMSKAGYNNIKPYNKSELVKAGQFEKFPYIVIIVDELAEIMQANKKEAESCIQRITQLARACGMHMVLATQRPSVDIITGVIKNNIPSRVAFSLQSGIDSKTIINTVGAEKLLGKGDMIFAPTGTSAMPRLQASYASDEEIKAVIDYDIKNNKAVYDDSIQNAFDAEQVSDDSGAGAMVFDDMPPQKSAPDSYFKTAVKLVMANRAASVSFLQRRLSIGFARAGRIIDQMEDKGYISPPTGAKNRAVLITPEQFAQDFGEDFNNYDE